MTTTQSNNKFPLPQRIEPQRWLYPYELSAKYPRQLPQTEFIAESRNTIQNILQGRDPRLLLIVGPCSIHDLESTLEYAKRLKKLSRSISDTFFVLMRVYFEKPRTVGGWKGFTFDPYLNGSNDIQRGHEFTRHLLLLLTEMEIPIATEFLEPTSGAYFGDLISWGCVGARTVESQVHRQMASGFPMPMAFKNTTSGNVEAAVNGIHVATQAHSFIGVNHQGLVAVLNTEGNPCCHLMLRGGKTKPNYDSNAVADATKALRRAELSPHLLIDCSHDNSSRNCDNQALVFKSVVGQVLDGNRNIKGLSFESHLHGGKQPFPQKAEDLKYGVSLTDSCMGWEATEKLIYWGHSVLKNVCFLLLLVFGLNSCQSPERLSAFSEYITREQLASYRVGTPDPALNCPPIGQRLFIKWNLPEEYAGRELLCKLYMRFRDRSEVEETILLKEPSGVYVYSLLNDDFFSRQGFQTYKLNLYVDEVLEEEWCHQMWVDLITFPDVIEGRTIDE